MPVFLRSGLTLLLALASPAAAQDRPFSVTNASGQALLQFFASPTNAGDWDRDILGRDSLADGATARLAIETAGDRCAHDLLMVFEDGAQRSDTVDVCASRSYVID